LVAIFAWAALFCGSIGLRLDDFRPGIGDPEQAKAKIRGGMTKDEVRSVLGRPHGQWDGPHGSRWVYRSDAVGSCLLSVEFGPDDRVTSSEWWVN
jgi:outer membrane protein assembly factor BamE (lipoprotein component of BamABCDE complex)